VTEAEWLSCGDPARMLESLAGRATDRKARLFACACCRGVAGLGRSAGRCVRLAERYADGHATAAERDAGRRAGWRSHAAGVAAGWVLAEDAAGASARFAGRLGGRLRGAAAGHLRDLFGNPFRPVAVDPSWLTPTVVALAAGIYADGAFDRLPILADALQAAGCDNADVLGHCRGPGPHVRGCWVTDLVLGKE
jgi:hypothetical protein